MAADSADLSHAVALTKRLISSLPLGKAGIWPLVLASYAIGTHHKQIFGTILKVVIALGAEIAPS